MNQGQGLLCNPVSQTAGEPTKPSISPFPQLNILTFISPFQQRMRKDEVEPNERIISVLDKASVFHRRKPMVCPHLVTGSNLCFSVCNKRKRNCVLFQPVLAHGVSVRIKISHFVLPLFQSKSQRKALSVKINFTHMQMNQTLHMKSFALRLTLKHDKITYYAYEIQNHLAPHGIL